MHLKCWLATAFRHHHCAHVRKVRQTRQKDQTAGLASRGLADRGPSRSAATLVEAIRVRRLYGFRPVKRPRSNTDALGKFLPDQDHPNEGVFSFQDDDEQCNIAALRPDCTVGSLTSPRISKALPKPIAAIAPAGYALQREARPGPLRQFMQFDADTVGAPSCTLGGREICMMTADAMEAPRH